MHHAGVSAQMPFEQSFEQHSVLPPQEFPADLHAVVIGAHLPLLQLPLQQDALPEHAWLSLMHC